MDQENSNNNHLENTLESPTETKLENGLLGALSKCLTFAPLMLEQFTGQKVPQMSGTIAEIQSTINQFTPHLQTIINNQNKIWQKLTSLENNAQQKLVNLANKVDKLSGLKLTHKQETRQIEYNQKPANLLKDEY